MTELRRWEEVLDEDLQDPAVAATYLDACLEGGDPNVFLIALRDVARARGGIAEDTSHDREHLYRVLSESGRVDLANLEAILDALGFRLSITLKESD
jgi:probable addiction module antidote protein